VLLRRWIRKSLSNAPRGERYAYSNPGYTIVQKLVEDASSEPFERFATQSVLEAAGMQQSSFAHPAPEAMRARVATGYTDDLAPYEEKMFPFLAAGGMWSTPSDLARFAAALMDDYNGKGRIVSKSVADQVFARSSASENALATMVHCCSTTGAATPDRPATSLATSPKNRPWLS